MRRVKVAVIFSLIKRLFREDVAYYADGDEDVCYGAIGGRRMRGGVLGELLRERKGILREVYPM